MRLDSVYVKNYRCFEELDISLNKNVTLFVGKNGAGKTAILDAIAVSASTFLNGIEGGISRKIQKEDARYRFYEIEGMIDSQHQFPVVISGKGECGGRKNTEWTCALNAVGRNTAIQDVQQLTEIAEEMQNKVMMGDTDVALPAIFYYGTGRLYGSAKGDADLRSSQKLNRQAGYIDCMMAESNEKMMLGWFEKMTLKSLQQQQKTGTLEKMPQLQIVEDAICHCFSRISGYDQVEISFELDTQRIMIEYVDEEKVRCRFALNELSDGYKSTLSMIGDIAYRMAVLNPQLGKEVLKKTTGIILIDEIDLHLHPQWQQTILKDLQTIFPLIQFVTASHAPEIINSVPKENIRILDHGKIRSPIGQTYGRDANSILREVMQVEERPKEIQQLLRKFYSYIDDMKLREAEAVLRELERILGDTDPEINGAKVTLEFEKMQEEQE